MVKKDTKSFYNGRGQRLHTVSYLPEASPHALLIFHHGYGEHTGRYDYCKPLSACTLPPRSLLLLMAPPGSAELLHACYLHQCVLCKLLHMWRSVCAAGQIRHRVACAGLSRAWA